MKIGILINPVKHPEKKLIEKFRKYCKIKKIEIIDIGYDYKVGDINKIDLLITIGGDGTIITGARRLKNKTIPILGINAGTLGFLTEDTLDNLINIFKKFLKKDYYFDKRMLINIKIIRNNKVFKKLSALNDCVIDKGSFFKLFTLEVFINNRQLTIFKGDGLIFATPTGSTAHNLAASGPILEPKLKQIIITPICAHSLSVRPIVVSEKSVIEVKISQDAPGSFIIIDGQVKYPCMKNDIIQISSSNKKINLIRFTNRTFFDVLKEKLYWRGY